MTVANSEPEWRSAVIDRRYRASGSLSQCLAVDLVNPDAAHLRACRHKVDLVNSAVVASHVDGHRSAVGAGTFLRPNVKRSQREILPIHRHVESFVF